MGIVMAGDWIPWCKGLAKKPEVFAVARATGRSRRDVAATLMEFWEWADGESADGALPGLSLAQLTDAVPGTDEAFWLAVVQAGWLEVSEDCIRIPNFERWLGRCAKRRVVDNDRKRAERASAGPPERPSIPTTLRRRVIQRDGARCVYCGWRPPERTFPWTNKKADLLSMDHVVPVSRGGSTTACNLVTACLRCNAQKFDQTPEEAGMEMKFLTDAAMAELVRNESDKNRTTVQDRTGQTNTDPPTPLPGGEGGGEASPPLTPQQFLEAWNGVPAFVRARGLSGTRARWFQARVRDAFWMSNWREALQRASKLPFCLGQNDRGWRATVDWFLRPQTVMRLIEGGYDFGGARPPKPAETSDERARRLAAEAQAREKAIAEAVDPATARELLSRVVRNGRAAHG